MQKQFETLRQKEPGQRKMKEENILQYTLEELENIPDETDWERVNKMTDEEVEAAAKKDPDVQPLTEAEFNQFKRTIYVKGEKVWEDSKTIREWLAERGKLPTIVQLDPDSLQAT